MKNVIHFFGASGSGTSTLGKAICTKSHFTFMDTDDYLWIPTDPKYTVKRDANERIEMMQHDIKAANHVVIAGSLVGWGDVLISEFTLAVRLVVPTEIRINRLRKREFERFGERILPGGDMYDQHLSFLKWAEEYDSGNVVRSKRSHDLWQKKLACKQLTLDGTLPVEDLTDLVLQTILKKPSIEK